jgi:hypothetical protein
MARLAGTAGEVTIDGASATGIKSWTLDDVQNILDGKGFDDVGLPHPVAGGYDWTGSFEGPKDGAPIARGTTIALVLKESQTATQKWSGNAIISGRHPSVASDGLVTYSYDFVGYGALTAPTA